MCLLTRPPFVSLTPAGCARAAGIQVMGAGEAVHHVIPETVYREKGTRGYPYVDHHDSHCTQDEAYHTASQAPFRRTTWQQKLNYAVILFESSDNFEK